jgi:hypothetical protein
VEELAAERVSMGDAWTKAGVEPCDLLVRRWTVSFTRGGKLCADQTRTSGSQIAWDTEAALYTVDAPAAKAVVGRCAGKTTRLDGVEFEVKSNERNFAALTLSAMDDRPVAQSRRLLLAAAGNVENTGMDWNAGHTSVGSHWGQMPTVCEGIAAKIAVATQLKSAKVFALDGSGARAGEVPSALADGRLTFEIGPQFRTLWYEIAAE